MRLAAARALHRRLEQLPPHPRARLLHASKPAEVGPLIAGIGVAAVIYGTKMLFEVASSGKVQEAVRRARSAAEEASTARKRTVTEESPAHSGEAAGRSAESYFTTDVMGIDLGHGAKEWSGACAAVVSNGAVRLVENEQGARCTPSVVAFTDGGEVLVGPPAKNLLFSRSAKTIVGHQLLHGVEHGSAAFEELVRSDALPFDTSIDTTTGAALIQVLGVAHKPEAVSARVIDLLRGSAEAAVGGGRSILSAVIAVPVLATDRTRAALVAAGQRAGLHKVRRTKHRGRLIA